MTPNALAQFDPPANDHEFDRRLAAAATLEVEMRIIRGEREAEVIRDVVDFYRNLFISEPWSIWHPRVRRFITLSDATDLDGYHQCLKTVSSRRTS